MKFSLSLLTILISVVSGHFTLDYPPTTGFDEDQEPNAPCGGFNPNLDNLTDFPLVGGEISFDLHHPYALFIARAQLVGSQDWVNLTDGFIYQSGLGEGCINALAVPQNWSNQIAAIQVVGQPPDGILYQCAGVKFVAGAPGTSSVCTNGSGVSITDSTNSFPVSNLSITFDNGPPANSTTEPTTTAAEPTSGSTGSASSSASSTAKSSAGSVRVETGLVLVVSLMLGAWFY